MRLRFTYHAQSQLLARAIEASRIADTIRNPQSGEPAPGGAMVYQKKFNGKTLEVVCVKAIHKNEYLVLTMYYL